MNSHNDSSGLGPVDNVCLIDVVSTDRRFCSIKNHRHPIMSYGAWGMRRAPAQSGVNLVADQSEIDQRIRDEADKAFILAIKVAADTAKRLSSGPVASQATAEQMLLVFANIIKDVNRQNFREVLRYQSPTQQ